jgi:hypothetical protein
VIAVGAAPEDVERQIDLRPRPFSDGRRHQPLV